MLLLGAVSIGAFGFGAGYYCAADSSNQSQDAAAPVVTADAEQKLAEAIQEIRRLQGAAANTAARAAPGARVVKPQTYAVLADKLDKLPEPFIEAQLEKYLGRESLEKISDTRAFSRRLLEVALEDQAEPPTDDDAVHPVDIQFSKSPLYGKQMLAQDVAVSKYEPLFAHILSNEAGEVIVKWQDAGSGEILIFQKISIGPGSEPYVVATPATGWRNTLYRVSLNSIDDSVKLMGSNAYNVSQVYDDGGRKPNTEVIQDLVSMGLAVPKRPVK